MQKYQSLQKYRWKLGGVSKKYRKIGKNSRKIRFFTFSSFLFKQLQHCLAFRSGLFGILEKIVFVHISENIKIQGKLLFMISQKKMFLAIYPKISTLREKLHFWNQLEKDVSCHISESIIISIKEHFSWDHLGNICWAYFSVFMSHYCFFFLYIFLDFF